MAFPDEAALEGEPLLSRGPSTRNRSSSRAAPHRTSDPGKRTRPSTSVLLRVGAAMYSFVVLGMLASTLGVMVPPLESYYGLSDVRVSSVFLVWPAGYLGAACLNGGVHARFGQRGVAAVGPLFHVVLAAAAASHPPFPAVLAALALGSLGTGVLDGSFCAWAGGMGSANVVQGFLHGSYSAGAAVGPFLAGTMFSVGGMPWYAWYYVLLGASILEAIALLFAFRTEDSAKYHAAHSQAALPNTQSPSPATATMFKHPATWICAAYFLACVGTENAVSGWIVVFMTRVNHASAYLASLSSSGFWIGQALGRLALGPVTEKLGVRPATIIYLLAALFFEVLFASARVPLFSTAAIALLGFCLGPLFPNGVFTLTRLLPRELHVAAISFVVLIGQVGGALLPFALGALAETLGIEVFQVVVFAQLVATLLIWLAFPRLPPASVNREDRVEETVTQ